MDDVRAMFEGMSHADAQLLAMMFPRQVGNMNGVPFQYRADANLIHVVAQLKHEKLALSDLEADHEDNQHDWDLFGLNNNDLDDDIKDQKKLVAMYESIINDDRQIILFDPYANNDGKIAELHGSIDESTRNLGVLVPGTTNRLNNFESTAGRSRSFMARNLDDSLAMISWIGGDLPDLADAVNPGKANTLAPLLEEFSYAVDQEIEHSAASPNDVQRTYAGHSYGGAVAGTAEAHGLRADRVLHVESAGVGYGIDTPKDLPSTQKDVKRYSMTAPGDFIGATQGFPSGTGLGHGADPDTFEGTTRLHTGNYPEIPGDPERSNQPIQTGGSHSGVFVPESDAWDSMYAVFAGGFAHSYRTPIRESVLSRKDGVAMEGDVIDWVSDGGPVYIK